VRPAPLEVDHEPADRDDGSKARPGIARVAQRDPHAREQLVEAERLRQVIIRAGVHRPTLSASRPRAEITMIGTRLQVRKLRVS
jgi:hypothetical protein